MDQCSLFTDFSASSKKFTINDLSSPLIASGNYTVNITLSDGKDTRKYELLLIIYPPISEEYVILDEL